MGKRASGNRYLVVSDLHLADVEDHEDGWKFFKSSEYLWDQGFATLLDIFVLRGGKERSLTLILNGDIIDFDLVTAVPESPPWPVKPGERKRCLDATAPKSVWKLEKILSDHAIFLNALARYLMTGHTLVYVLGNHDREFHFPEVQQAFVEAMQRSAESMGGSFDASLVRFEPWFFTVPGEIFVEHGQQYDLYSSFRNVLEPVVEAGGEELIALPMGNLSNRYLMARMGFFNPHSGGFILNLFSYAAHWFRHYAFKRRSLLLTWLLGSFLVVGKLLETKRRLLSQKPRLAPSLEKYARKADLPDQTVRALYALQRPPITSRVFRMVREFWLDRLLLASIMTGGTLLLFFLPVPTSVKVMVPLTAFPLLYFVYEKFAQGETIFEVENHLPLVAHAIAKLVPVRLVVFGHTHVPRLIPLERDLSFVDVGSWAPVTLLKHPRQLAPGYRNYLYVSFDEEHTDIRFNSWHRGEAELHLSEESAEQMSNLIAES